jgi:NADP-dependent 3-hydroxy acid dehydrogenase YdfG/tetratricopeptide (TPR) repeat protein
MLQKKQIILAYCSDNADTAFLIDRNLSEAGIALEHLACDSGHPEVIKRKFIDLQVPVLMLVSDNYLKSMRCMDGALAILLELIRSNRVLPIIVDGVQKNANGTTAIVPTSFDRVSNVIQYMNHWQDLYLDMRKSKSSVSAEHEATFDAQLKTTRTISSEIGELLRNLRNIANVTSKEFTYNNYRAFFEWTGLTDRHTAFAATYDSRLAKQTAFVPPVAAVQVPPAPVLETVGAETPVFVATHNNNNNNGYRYDDTPTFTYTAPSDTHSDTHADAAFYEALAPVIADMPAELPQIEAKIALPSVEDFNKAAILIAAPTQIAAPVKEPTFIYVPPTEEMIAEPIENLIATPAIANIALPTVPKISTNINQLVDEIAAEVRPSTPKQIQRSAALEDNEYDILSSIFHNDDRVATPANHQAPALESIYSLLDETGTTETPADAEEAVAGSHATEHYTYIPVFREIENLPEPVKHTASVQPQPEIVQAPPKKIEPIDPNTLPIIRMELQKPVPKVNTPIATIRLESLNNLQPIVTTATMIEEANQLARMGKLEESLKIWYNVVASNPTDNNYRYTYAWLLSRKPHSVRRATHELETVLNSNPRHVDANYLLAEIAEEHRDFAMARNYYERVATLNPFFPNIHIILGELIYKNFADQKEEAAKYFHQAFNSDSNNTHARLRYAILQKEMGHTENAIRHLEKITDLNPTHSQAIIELANIYHDLDRGEQAYAYYLRASSINPTLKTTANEAKFKWAIPAIAPQTVVEEVESITEILPEPAPIVIEAAAPTAAAETVLAVIADESGISSFRILRVVDTETGIEQSDYFSNEVVPLIAAQENPLEMQAASEHHHTETSSIIDNIIEHPIEIPEITPEPTAPAANNVAKIVFITGATSGIGKATAEAFAKNGYRVIVTGRRADRLNLLQQEFQTTYNAAVHTLNFDVRDLNSVKNAIDNLPAEWRNVDILINNAGLAKGFEPIHEGNVEDWDLMIDTNLKGLLYMTRAITPQMVARKTGHIINIGSTAGKEVYPNGNVYCATKSAVDTLTRAIRQDLYKYGIRVSAVHPAATEETEFSLVRFDGNSDRAAKVYENFQPLKSSDVAEVIYFIASQPAHVNVQEIVVFPTQQAGFSLIDRSGR